MKTPSASVSARKVQVSLAHPASPRFRLSDPPAKATPKPRAAYVKKQKVVQSLATKAIQYLFENLGEWAVIGTYPVAKRSTKAGIIQATKANYAKVWYAQKVLDDALAVAVAYCSTSYDIDSRIDWSADGKARELRFRVNYVQDPSEYDNGMCEIHAKIESDMNYRLESADDIRQIDPIALEIMDKLDAYCIVGDQQVDGVETVIDIANRMVGTSKRLDIRTVMPFAIAEYLRTTRVS